MKPQQLRIPDEVLIQSRQDLLDNTEELLYLFSDIKQKYQKHWPHIQKHSQKIYPKTKDALELLNSKLLLQVDSATKSLKSLRKIIKKTASTPEFIDTTTFQLQEFRNLVRALSHVMAGLLTSTDWQSPAAEFSLISEAGRQTGTIKSSWNDYKRDQHADVQVYEQTFKKEYIDGLFTFPVFTYATNSGMAAFTTILSYLQGEHKLVRPVLVGKSTWFESKQMLKQILGHLVVEIDEEKMTDIQEQILLHQPSAIFLDTLGNSPEMPLLDVGALITFCKKRLKLECTLVLDNSSLGPTCQFMKMVTGKRSLLSVVGYESLNKFHQFGLDRTMGGILYAHGKDTIKLFDYREHMGTILSDSGALSLPTPNRKLLDKRLIRLQRNTMSLVSSIMEDVGKPNSPLHHVQYPRLTIHPSYSLASTKDFTGAYCMFFWKEKHQSLSFYKRFVKKLIKEAQKERIQLTHGTSFGLTSSRVYITAIRATETKPFIRFSPGTETKFELLKLTSVLSRTLSSFK